MRFPIINFCRSSIVLNRTVIVFPIIKTSDKNSWILIFNLTINGNVNVSRKEFIYPHMINIQIYNKSQINDF